MVKVVLVPFYRGAVVFQKKFIINTAILNHVLVPFYRGAVVFNREPCNNERKITVLVPFYRGAVVFRLSLGMDILMGWFSSPFIEERLYFDEMYETTLDRIEFSSPFIEERLYL